MKKKQSDRRYLIRMFKKRGVSRRQAVLRLNGLFAEIKNGLARGEEIELGWGKLKVVRHKHRTQTDHFLKRKLTTYKRPFTVVLEMNSESDRLLTQIVVPAKPGSPPGTKPFGKYYPLAAEWMSILPPKPWLNKADKAR
jgi:nucleoid DNA-binding protein